MTDVRHLHAAPSEAATLERCCRLVDIEFHAAALQRRRLRTTELEDEIFPLRWWVDLQFFILALWRLRRVVGLLRKTRYESDEIRSALASFDAATPSLRTIPPRRGSHVAGLLFAANLVLHSGVDDASGHFVGAYGIDEIDHDTSAACGVQNAVKMSSRSSLCIAG